MLFKEVVEELKAGKYCARDAWNSTGMYLVIIPGVVSILQTTLTPQGINVSNWLPLVVDFEADDWKEVTHAERLTRMQPPIAVVPPAEIPA